MKKKFLCICLILALVLAPLGVPRVQSFAEVEKPKLALVIDDFGEDRRGVEEMLSLDCPLTIAVMPGCEFSTADAESAHARGHEVILHMPMENRTAMPANYYGPVLIKNSFSETEAVETLTGALTSIPHAVGVNIHMGTGVSSNKKLITAMMNELKKLDVYFLDSKTIENTVCPECARDTGVKFYGRDVFLEPPGRSNYNTAVKQLLEAGNIAKTKGSAVAIGHVGVVGEAETARAIRDTIPKLEEMGVEIVRLSEVG